MDDLINFFWKVAALAIFFSALFPIGPAFAQETPVLIARGMPQISGWCGDHAVYFNADAQNGNLKLLDVISRRQQSLVIRSAAMLGCSPDGRWALTMDTQPGGLYGPEGGDPSCDEWIAKEPPRLVLWDTQNRTHQTAGSGYADFRWSPDGTVLLYRFRPFCDRERDVKNAFKLPPSVQTFRAVAVLPMIAKALGRGSGWPGGQRAGAMGWYAPDAFVVQLPVNEGWWLDDSTPAGALVAVRHAAGGAVRIEQLNPARFEPSWKLAIPQVPGPASDEILKTADCFVTAVPGHPTSMGCSPPLDDINWTGFRPDLARYCQTLSAGDVSEFCAPISSKVLWQRIVRGATVLIVKRTDLLHANKAELFRMDNDQGQNLK
jgi:hypothetical protein